MVSKRFCVAALVLGLSPILATAQKPYKAGKTSFGHIVGKGTPADLSHHRDNSAAVLNSNRRAGAASELTKIEQQSMRVSGSVASKSTRTRVAALPKLGAPKTERSAPINFAGHTPVHRQLTTNPKSGGGANGAAPKIH